MTQWMNSVAMAIGYGCMTATGVCFLLFCWGLLAQRMWDHARALGMMRDFRKWYRGDAFYHDRSEGEGDE